MPPEIPLGPFGIGCYVESFVKCFSEKKISNSEFYDHAKKRSIANLEAKLGVPQVPVTASLGISNENARISENSNNVSTMMAGVSTNCVYS